MALVRVFSPDGEPELLTVVALLEAHEIPCFVHNWGFSALYPGPRINAYNSRAIMVPEESALDALELIRDFQAQPSSMDPSTARTGRLRIFFEFLLFGWFVPGRRRMSGSST